MFLHNHGKTALKLKDREVSYDALLREVHHYSELFPATTDKVLIFSENRLEWVYSFYAGWKNNCTIIPVDYLSTAEEVEYIVHDSSPEVWFCSREREPVLRQVADSVGCKPQILIYEEINSTDLTAKTQPGNLASPDMNATALIIYTSGTTGTPKGVMLSFENILANIEAVSIGVEIYSIDERVMLLLPLHHIFPLLGSMIAPLFVGATVAICPSLQSEDIIKTLQDNRITILIGVPRLYKVISKGIMDKIKGKKTARLLYALAEKIGSRGLSRKIFSTVHNKFGGSLKYLVAGGAALDPEVGKIFTTLGFEILEGFGMTEAAPMITFTRPGQVYIGSAGTAMSCTRIEIREGEIVASGKNIMQGYLNRPEETAEVLQDGWLYTGDLGNLDDRGRIFITGRKKEIIVLASGKNINPVLIEQKLDQLTDCINEVGVFVKDDILQAVIRPDFQTLRKESIQDIDDFFRWNIIDAYNKTVSRSKRILKFTLIDEELPKTRLSKLKRFQLPELVTSREVRKSKNPAPEFAEYHIIKEFIEKQVNRDILADDHLEIDIALDSLDQISLLSFLKSTFGVEISEEKLMDHQTVRLLSTFVREKKEKIEVEEVNWQEILQEKGDLTLPKTWFTVILFQQFSKLFFSLYFRFTGHGLQHLPDTPCIIAPNHQSFYDALLVAAQFKGKFMRKTYFYAKEKHVQNGVIRFLADRNNVIVVDVTSGLRESIQKLAAVLEKGKNIMIFPEGTRSKDGDLGDFKKLFAILSIELGVPIIPVTINGAYQALPSGRLIPRPLCPISVTFEQPVYPQGHSYGSLTKEVYQQVEEGLLKPPTPAEP